MSHCFYCVLCNFSNNRYHCKCQCIGLSRDIGTPPILIFIASFHNAQSYMGETSLPYRVRRNCLCCSISRHSSSSVGKKNQLPKEKNEKCRNSQRFYMEKCRNSQRNKSSICRKSQYIPIKNPFVRFTASAFFSINMKMADNVTQS